MKPRMSSASLGILHQRQRLVERVDEPALGRGQNDIEQADHIGGDGMPGYPVQRDVGGVEVHLACLDLDGPRIDFLLETARSQHASGV